MNANQKNSVERAFGALQGSSVQAYGQPVPGGTAPRESHIPEEIRLLVDAVDTLTAEFNGLLARLISVTQPLSPIGEQSADDYRVPLASEIRGQRHRIQAVINLIRDAGMNLEL